MLIIVPVRNLVLFPGTVVPVAINRERSLAAAQEAVRAERKVGFLLQQDPDLQSPTGRDLYKVGTVASIVRYVTGQDGTHHLVVQGERRFRVLDWQSGLPFMVARVEFLTETQTTPEVEARALHLKSLSAEAVSLLPQAPAELANAIQSIESPSTVAGDGRSQGAPRPGRGAADQAHRSAALAAQARRADPRSDRRAPQGGAAARAAPPDPQGAGRGR
jgi:ATP-dependent Lon protease